MRELVVIPGDDIGREVIPLAVRGLRALLPNVRLLDAEAGYEHAWRMGQSIESTTLEQIQQARSVLMGPEREFPEGVASAIVQLTRAFDLYATLYHLYDPAQGLDLLLLLEHGAPTPLLAPREKNKSLTPIELWSATRLGNLAAWLMASYQGRVALAHDSEEPFAHAVAGGVGEAIESERLDAIFLLNQFTHLARDFTLVVASTATGELLLSHLFGKVVAPERVGRLLLGPNAAVATPAHGPLREQLGWGFASPVGVFRALVLLLRHWWNEEGEAMRLQDAIDHALQRRCTPDMGGVHTMYEVTHCILQELRPTAARQAPPFWPGSGPG